MEDKKVMILKPNTISPADKKQLMKAGYIVIETEDPDAIKIIDSFGTIEDTMVVYSLLQAMDYGNDSTCRNAFGKIIREKLMTKYKVRRSELVSPK